MAKIVFFIQREDVDPLRAVQQKVLFPIESAFAGALLKQAGHIIQSFDINLRQDNDGWHQTLKDVLHAFKPDFIVSAPQTLSFLIKENRDDTKTAFRLAKELNNDIKTIYCGPFATSYPQKALVDSNADYLICGEYDQTILSVINNVLSGNEAINITGVISRHSCSNKVYPVYTKDIDKLPFPAYEEFNYKNYFNYTGRGNLRYAEYSHNYTHYQTSRGCSCQCCFCNVSFLRGGRKYRSRSVELILNDIETLIKQYGIKEIHFLDENLTFNRKRTLNLCRNIVERKLNFKWIASGGLSVYSLNKEEIEWMWKAGCYRLNLAFESGSQEVLDNIIKKPVKLDRDIEKVKVARTLGFEIIGYFIIGLPGETRSQIMQTIEFASNPIFDYVTISIATPQVGTKLEKICKEQGLIKGDFFLADISRRSAGIISNKQFSVYELEEMRWKEWDKINFSTEERRRKICQIMGISSVEIACMRKETECNFKKRWQKSN